jgi:hypothetical protein
MSLPSTRHAALGLALAGLLIGLGGVMHPRVDTAVEFEQGLVGMFESGSWTVSHLLTMAGFAALAASLALLARGFGNLRVLGWIAAGAAAFAALETLPHLLAASDAAALRAGEAAPLADLHTAVQAFSTPLVGLSIAALALARPLDAGRIATALAVVGGVAFAFAGPAIAITGDSGLSPLFVGSAGIAIWAVVAGLRTARAATAPVLVAAAR